jgi:hypothetical protein
MEYRSIGKKPDSSVHISITPALHHSITPENLVYLFPESR